MRTCLLHGLIAICGILVVPVLVPRYTGVLQLPLTAVSSVLLEVVCRIGESRALPVAPQGLSSLAESAVPAAASVAVVLALSFVSIEVHPPTICR